MDNLLEGWPEDFCIASLHNYLANRQAGSNDWRKTMDIHWVMLTSCVRAVEQESNDQARDFSISEVLQADFAIRSASYSDVKYPARTYNRHLELYIKRMRHVRNL